MISASCDPTDRPVPAGTPVDSDTASARHEARFAKAAGLRTKLLATPGLRTVRRPVTPDSGAHFDLRYVRTPPAGTARAAAGVPILFIPGGPGLGSIAPYSYIRNQAAARGLDTLMVEHRGVGLSRRDDTGRDLPPEAIDIEAVVADLAAVLDDAGIERVCVYGASYGTYLAQGLALRHPERVHSLVLDSPILSAGDSEVVKENLRSVLWEGQTPATAESARIVRELWARGDYPDDPGGAVPRAIYEFAGPSVWERLARALERGRGRRAYARIEQLTTRETEAPTPYLMEFDLVGRIAYRELDYAPAPDGRPFDPNVVLSDVAKGFPAFEREPYDLPEALRRCEVPVVVVSGEHDLRTPRVVAQRAVDLAPQGVLVPLAGMGHSAFDFHPLAAIAVATATAAGHSQRLPALADRIAALPRPLPSRGLQAIFTAAVSAAGLGW